MSPPAFTPEQRTAIADRRGARLLAANAGSGKTAVIVERFVEAVIGDAVAVDRVLALTFTEKAAGELRERIRRRFTEIGAHEQARAAEGAWIGTIHGFCARVLRAHPFGAGLDPRVVVLDEAAARRAAWAAYDRALDAWSAVHGADAIDLLAAYGSGLREVVLGVHAELRSRGEAFPQLPVVPARPEPTAERAALRDAVRAAAGRLARERGGTRIDAARAALDACEQLLAGAEHPLPSALGRAKLSNGARALGEPECVAYREAWEIYRRACADHRAVVAVALVDALLQAYGAEYAAAKVARAAVDFEDLQLAVRDLLAADAGLRARWAERFELVMVDEFQDTNRLQLAILGMLERDNLFAVGDEFQSIYGFRHADVEIFRERGAALGTDRTLRLRANFRSRESLLDVVNAAFAPSFGESFEPLVAGRGPEPATVEDAGADLRLFDPDHVGVAPAAPPLAPVELLLCDRAGWEDAEDGRRAEARLVAQRLRAEVDAGRRPGDIVVLVRAVASLRGIEEALEAAGMPNYVVGGRGYWSREQVRDGIAYLAVLANPLDETALYHVLASPFAGATADDLVLVAQAGREGGSGAWAALRAGVTGVEHLAPFVELVASERLLAERLPVEVLLERAIAATGYDLATLARVGGERRLANLRKLMRLAREYERAEGRDLRGFLAYAVTQDLTEAREGEAALDSEGLDAVRVMTIHRAKGLEFPVVCVADLGRQGPSQRPGLLVGADGRVGLRLRTLGGGASVAALDWEALWEERQRREEAEEQRLFYVAMTRARETLILAGGVDLERWPEPRPSGPPLDWIARALLDELPHTPGDSLHTGDWQGRQARVRVQVVTAATAPPPAATAPRDSDAPGTSLPAAPAVDSFPHSPAARTLVAGASRRLSYSSLGDYARCPYRYYLERVLGLRAVKAPPPPSAPDAAPAEPPLDPLIRGTIVHQLLEHVDLAAATAPDPAVVVAVGAAAGVELTDAQVADVLRLVAAFLASALAERLRAASAVRREAPFAFPLEPGPGAPLVHGFVDVLARADDGAVVVVDYKTDALGEADPEAVVARDYAAQRLVYALAALREGAPSVEVAHCFLERAGEPASARYVPSDAPALAEQLIGLASGILAGKFPPTDTPHRDLCGTCPGRRALCSWPEERTLAKAYEDASAATFSGSGGPS